MRRSAPQSVPGPAAHIAPLIGLIFGCVGAGTMYVWQHSIELTVATFVIAGYTAGLWFHLSSTAPQWNEHYRYLRTMPINSFQRRIRRLFTDLGFWWSLCFGLSVIGSAGWYAGLRHAPSLAAVETLWGVTTLLLNFETTILQPTTRCRHCSYQLLGQLDPSDPDQRVRCPECGKKWTKADLCLLPRGTVVINSETHDPTTAATPTGPGPLPSRTHHHAA